VRSHDGTALDGWIASPTVPAGVKTPTVLVVSPYFDVFVPFSLLENPSTPATPDCDIAQTGCGYWHEGTSVQTRVNFLGLPPIHLIQRGFTLAFFSVRGTGSSGGCFEFGGKDEQRDQVALIEWLAKQPWSNGRVGMGGLSYLAYTSWQAAVQAPKALKTIVTAGDLTDFFQLFHTPQGALNPIVSAYLSPYETEVGAGGGAASHRTGFLQHEACPHADMPGNVATGAVTGDRNAAYWKERNLSLRLPAVRAAVLHTDGFLDPGHAWQSDAIWGSLRSGTPEVQVAGWWAHEYPTPDNTAKTRLNFPSGVVTWESTVVRWLDYWLKGIGPAPKTSVMHHQDQDGRWHESTSWSAVPRGKQVLYLSGPQLTPTAGRGSTSFLSAPATLDAAWTEQAVKNEFGVQVEFDGSGLQGSLCPGPEALGLSRKYLTNPVTARTLIAGNPFAFLRLSADRPGGLVSATLFDIGPDFTCAGAHYTGARWVSSGAADLSYYRTPFTPHPFPVGRPTSVRIDLRDVSYVLAPGHRLALVLDHGDLAESGGAKDFPTITVLGESQLVVPVAEGTLGGKRPTQRYPQRPFTPRGYRD
jgi:putative CocE/NonD family hydrolase